MSIAAKICGINSGEAMAAAIEGGADYVGLVFYEPSPRAVSLDSAAELASMAPDGILKVGLFVDAPDDLFESVLAKVELDMLQLHGGETPTRVRDLKGRFGLPAMKAVKVAGADDLDAVAAYEGAADMILFDAKPPKDMTGALPGGNALSFDWHLLAGRSWPLPWMLSGGLDAANLAEAVAVSGAPAVDVSSGVEDRPGAKNPIKIKAFLKAAKAL